MNYSYRHIALLFCLITILWSCSQKPIYEQQTVFTFEYYGDIYQILGYSDPKGNREGINDLILKKDGVITIWHRDTNQDGFIDEALTGDISIEKANQIYHYGIQQAIELNRLQEQPYPRKFETTIGNFHYEIISFSVGESDTYNIFIIYNRTTDTSIRLRDSLRNGILDDVDDEAINLQSYQKDYDHILQIGLERRKVLFDGETYLVLMRQS